MEFREGHLDDPAVQALLKVHLANAHALSPPDAVHALDITGLQAKDVTFWSVWRKGDLLGCGALKEIDPQTGEIKSMHTYSHLRGQGIGKAVLDHLIQTARARNYTALFLETGTSEAYIPARKLYRRAGFTDCSPFAHYKDDPHSCYMQLELAT